MPLPRRRQEGLEPSTYVPCTRPIEHSDLPLPEVTAVGRPSFREYVMHKRASTASTSVIDVPQVRYTWDESELGVEVTATSFPITSNWRFKHISTIRVGDQATLNTPNPFFIRYFSQSPCPGFYSASLRILTRKCIFPGPIIHV